MAQSPLGLRRIGVDTTGLPPGTVFGGPFGRVVLNLIVLAGDCLPNGGTILLMGGKSDLIVRIVGEGAIWPPGFADCMRDEASALAAVTNARTVQMPLTALLAFSRALRLSPVIGPGGIEAVRLSVT